MNVKYVGTHCATIAKTMILQNPIYLEEVKWSDKTLCNRAWEVL